MDENLSRGEQAAEEVARRWMAAMQSMGDQLLRQQAFQQVVRQSLGAYAYLFKLPPR